MVVLVKVVERHSFTAAAAALGLSPQMVGRHIASLEARLGTRLLNRTTRRQSLTEAGRVFYERCRALLADAEAADEAVRALDAAPRGRLRVNAPVTVGAVGLAPLLARYAAAHPEVEVDRPLTDRYVDIVEEGDDAVLRFGALVDLTLAARALAPLRLVAWAAPASRARRGAPRDPDELAGHECLLFVATNGAPMDPWSFRSAGRTRAVRPSGRIRANDARALHDLAVGGAGVIMQPEAVVAGDVAAGRLVRVLPDREGPVRPIHLVFSAARPQTPKRRCFVDLAVAGLGREDGPGLRQIM